MTNPNKDFEAWGDSLGPDIEAYVREIAALPGYVVMSAAPVEDESEATDQGYDRQELLDVDVNGINVKYRVRYLRDTTNEAS
jgi:hypothetical protein